MANLVELFDNIVQMQNLNGVPLAAGKLYVYALGRTRLMDTWSDVDGESLNPNPIILDDAGQAHVYVSDDFDYTLVVCDQYNNEIFSLDKYLYSKGSHSHADVAVAPSESIAVSSYHVGETTVYVPYLTGQLGKVYEGIDPIVVNNQVDKISANHVPLGVQDPLYFVQDDEEACIIGCSAQTEIPSELSGKWDEASDAVIANSAQWAEGTEYEAGSYVDITNNTISVTGLTPVPADTASTGLVASVSADITALIPDTSDMATQTWVNEQGFLTAHQDISNKLDTTAFSTVSGDFLTAIPSEYVTENTLQSGLSSKLDSTAFSTVSGNFLTAHQSLEGYATEQWVSAQGYLTAHQSLDGLMSADLLEISDNKITGYNGTAFAGQGGGGVTGDFELSAGSGISIVDYPLEQKTVISVTAQGGNPEVEQAVIDNSATWNNVSAKLDTTAFSDVSGTFLTAHQDLSDYQTIAGMTAYQPVGSYMTANALDNVSGNWNEVSAKLDTTAFSDVSGTFLTAHQDLSNYATTAQLADKVDSSAIGIKTGPVNTVTAISGTYISAWTANNASHATKAWSATRAKNDENDIPITSYLREVPDTYLQNTDLSTEDGKVTAISGIPLSAGGDVPEGVMVESGLEYNAVNEISGYNGSAIAQYGHEAQWLVHDDTLCHLSNSAQYALGVNVSALQRLMGIDETVLYNNTAATTADVAIGSTFNVNEPITNFNKFKIYFSRFPVTSTGGQNGGPCSQIREYDSTACSAYFVINETFPTSTASNTDWFDISMLIETISGTTWKCKACYQSKLPSGQLDKGWKYLKPYKVIGIGRKEV